MLNRIRNLLGLWRRASALRGGSLGVAARVGRIFRQEGFGGIRRRLAFAAGRVPDGLAGTTAAPASRCRPARAFQLRPGLRPGALLVGHPFLVSGRGEDIRISAGAFARAEIPFSICDVFDGGNPSLHPDFPYRDRLAGEPAYRAQVCVLNADEMANARSRLGAGFFAGRYTIGYWAWELSRFPDAWSGAFDTVEEIWAPSRFTQQAIAEKAPCPVVRMPLAVELPVGDGLPRGHFGLPEDRYLFLFFFDFSSYIARKNPLAAIRAFRQAFDDRPRSRAQLVIKLNGTDLRPEDYRSFLASPELDDPRIILVDRVLDGREMRSLMQACDCFVSLHRAEGFGRGPAEAMFYGKPVVVTGYSGNLDFTNELDACVVEHELVPVGPGEYPHGAGQVWAEPDVEQAAWYMRRLVEQPEFGAGLGRQAAGFIRRHHSLAAVGERYRRRLARLGLV